MLAPERAAAGSTTDIGNKSGRDRRRAGPWRVEPRQELRRSMTGYQPAHWGLTQKQPKPNSRGQKTFPDRAEEASLFGLPAVQRCSR